MPDRDISLYIDNVVIASSYIGPMTGAPCAPTSGTFIDDDGSIFEADIEKLAAEGITKGCNPPINDRYCPDDSVTRGQMAAFLVRALDLTDSGSTDFVDDDGSVFETDIEDSPRPGSPKAATHPSTTATALPPTSPVSRWLHSWCGRLALTDTRDGRLCRRQRFDLRSRHRTTCHGRDHQGLQPTRERPLLPHQPGHPGANGGIPIPSAGVVASQMGPSPPLALQREEPRALHLVSLLYRQSGR